MQTAEELLAIQSSALDEMYESAEWVAPKETVEVPAIEPVVVPVTGDGQTAPNALDLGVEATGVVDVKPVEPIAEAIPSVEDMLRTQLQELTARLSQPVQQVYPTVPAGTQIPTPPPAAIVEAVAPVVTQDAFVPGTYLTDDELDRVIDDPKLIVMAIQRAQADVMKQVQSFNSTQQASIQMQVQQAVQQQIMVTKAITDFYDANQDLRKYAQFTQFVLAEVEQKSLGTNKTYADIFEETANETRKRLGLANPAVQTIERGRVVEQKPAFAGSKKGGNARPQEQKEMFSKDAADMMDMLD